MKADNVLALAQEAHEKIMAVVRLPGVTQEVIDSMAVSELMRMYLLGYLTRSQELTVCAIDQVSTYPDKIGSCKGCTQKGDFSPKTVRYRREPLLKDYYCDSCRNALRNE